MYLGKGNRPGSRRPTDCFDGGVERDQRLCEVTRIRGDTMIAGAEQGVLSIDAPDRRTAGARTALVARPGDLAKVFTTRSLQHVPAQTCHVPDLAAGGQHQRLRYERIIVPDGGMVLCLRHADEGTEPKAMRV